MARVRRLNEVTRATLEGQQALKARVDDTLDMINQIEKINAEIAQNLKAIEADMVKYRLSEVVGEKGAATYLRPAGKGTNIINPKLYNQKVKGNNFYDSITVSIAAAKKHLSEKELAEITTYTPPGVKDKVVKVMDLQSFAKKCKDKT